MSCARMNVRVVSVSVRVCACVYDCGRMRIRIRVRLNGDIMTIYHVQHVGHRARSPRMEITYMTRHA